MAPATDFSITPSRLFTVADAPLMAARAAISRRSIVSPEMGKLSTARCVCAAHRASSGTSTSPMLSCSMRMLRRYPRGLRAGPQPTSGYRRPVAEFAYQDMLPLGPDDTEYRLLTSDGVSTFDANGRR